MAGRTASGRVMLSDLSAEAFVSPADRAALANLQKLPLLPLLVEKFNEVAIDRLLYAINSSESVRCGPKQFPTVHRLLREACAVLDVPEPELYLRYDYRYNAYTAGVKRTFIVLHSALVNDLTDEELLYVIGHEVGHIKCGHVLYRMLGLFILILIQGVGTATLGLGPLPARALLAAFLEWVRQSEVSCDRAGLLVCQDQPTAFTALMKLGCGATRFNDEMNLEAFMEQARTYSDATGGEEVPKKLLFLLYQWQLTHPQVVYRAKLLEEWMQAGDYQKILSGDYLRDEPGPDARGARIRCQVCRTIVSAGVPYCPGCGTPLGGAAAGASRGCPECGGAVPAGSTWCRRCGAEMAAAAEEPV